MLGGVEEHWPVRQGGGGGMTGGVAALGGVAAFAVIAVGVGVYGTYKIADYMIVSV